MKNSGSDTSRTAARRRAAAWVLLGVLAAGGGWWLAGRVAGPARRINSLGMELVRVPAGVYLRGSAAAERDWAVAKGGNPEWIAREFEPQTVTLPREFWFGATEVTLGQFRSFAGATGYRTVAERGEGPLAWNMKREGWNHRQDRSWRKPGFPHDDRHPVTCLNWRDARVFCQWLTERERAAGLIRSNESYRLPDENEWEGACRGGGDGYYSWGDDAADAVRHANILDATPRPDGSRWAAPSMPWTDGWAFTAPVKTYAPAPAGFYDLHGNVWEWCRQAGRNDGAAGPASADAEDGYILRGGSWDNQPGNIRCASRRFVPRDFASDASGFRVVLAGDSP